jgi:hypothetical protein
MKRMPLHLISCLLLAVTLFTVSCSKDGAAGPQGEEGLPGPQGPRGPQGETGTTTVVYSPWLDVKFLPHIEPNEDGVPETLGFYSLIDVPKLDLEMLEKGEIKVYLNLDSADDPTIVPLPYFNIYNGLSILATFYKNTIELYANADASTGLYNGQKVLQFRYVLIPGSTEARKKEVDWNNYAAVKAYLGLKD